ncbi:OmpA family protein [Dokdonella soli]|uniref:OmpA family protein n=1 Tax=Dokdonella soli TaxID=529810 RepID=A0ABP3TN05_9GAMM
MRSLGLCAAVLVLASISATPRAQDIETDCEGCKDHPMLARYPGSILFGADQKAFEEATMPIGPVTQSDAGEPVAPKTLNVTGKRTRLLYLAPATRSALEVFVNYKEALAKAGMSVTWTCSDTECGTDFLHTAPDIMHLNLTGTSAASDGFTLAERPRYLLAKLARPQGDVQVMVMAADLTEAHRPAVYVMLIESKPMDTGLVSLAANALDQNLITTGKAVIYGITFDFDKADIKPESKPQLDQIGKLLTEHADLKLAITGHTDNQGGADYNQKLSQRRAEAIVAALSGSYGIAANRLSAQGMGASSPVASNDNEDGRAKNRRVELVKR